jgi:hypothetical protein
VEPRLLLVLAQDDPAGHLKSRREHMKLAPPAFKMLGVRALGEWQTLVSEPVVFISHGHTDADAAQRVAISSNEMSSDRISSKWASTAASP